MSSTSGNYRPPTPEEVGLLGLVFSVIVVCLFGLGCYLLYLSFGQPEKNAELAFRARWIGIGLIVGTMAVKFRWLLGALTWLDAARQRFLAGRSQDQGPDDND